ncbi:hypothetical protein ACLOFA_02965 [Limosilactobacillus mucosae]
MEFQLKVQFNQQTALKKQALLMLSIKDQGPDYYSVLTENNLALL